MIIITEGEKDADNAIDKLGLVATTNPNGAGKWLDYFKDHFKGKKRVAIIEDNDEPGRRHVQDVARNLNGTVPDIRIVSLPDLEEGGDLSNWIEAGGTKEELLALIAITPIYNKKRIVLRPQIDDVARDIERAMVDARVNILNNGGILVEPLWQKQRDDRGRELEICNFRIPNWLNYAELAVKHAVNLYRYDKRENKEVQCDIPQKVVETTLTRGHSAFADVVGIISSPTMRRDGTLLVTPGYDKETQLWYHPSEIINLTIPDNPTKEDAQNAIKTFKNLMSEVAFSQEDNHYKLNQSVALAAILTVVLRGAFTHCPMFLFRAHMAGTGKSYSVDIVSTIAQGRPCPVITATDNKEEMWKRLGAILLESPPFISLDNLTGDLESELLCQILTQDRVKTRILGVSKVPECAWRGVIFATGNNVTLAGNLTRRGLICNLDAVTETPELREFKQTPDPLTMIGEDRGKYLSAALTIARAYLIAGRPSPLPPLAGYVDWSRMVREPLVWLGEEDPVQSLEEARTEDPNVISATELIHHWLQHLGTEESFRVPEIIKNASEKRPSQEWRNDNPDYELVRPEFHTLLMEQAGTRGNVDPHKLGLWLRTLHGEVFPGGYRIIIAKKSKDGHRWKLEKLDTKKSKPSD